MAKLTEKQKRFVEEYLIDLNATQAAIRAGYKETEYTDTNANKILENTRIKKAINEEIAKRSVRTGVNADRVVRELAKIAFSKATDIIDFEDATLLNNISEEDSAVIQSVKVKVIPTQNGDGIEREIKLADKLKALELLGKHLGMYVDKTTVNLDTSKKFADICKQLGGEVLNE